MKIRFLKDYDCEVADSDELIYSETYHKNEVFDGDIVENRKESIDFQFGDGSMVFGLDKKAYEVIEK